MKTQIHKRKAVLLGIIVFFVDQILGNLLYMNPFVQGIFDQYKGLPAQKSMQAFGGMGNWVLINSVFSLVLIAVFIFLYLLLYRGLPGSGWKKGLFFGLIIGFIKSVPEAFNQFMLFNYPEILILIQMLNTLLGLTIVCVIMAVLFKKFRVVTEVSDE